MVTTSVLKDLRAGGQGFDPCLQQFAIFLFIFRESSACAFDWLVVYLQWCPPDLAIWPSGMLDVEGAWWTLGLHMH